ncbi:putative chitinase 3, partial [Stegodyphus mimosarum]
MRYCNRKDLAPPCDGSTTEQASSSQSQETTGGTTAVYPTESSTKGEKSECNKPGFFRCPEDCNKFYRCVDEEGDGQNLVRYDFKCPDGLIFDEKNKKCDWPSSELTCDSDSSTTYSTQTTRTSTSQSSQPQTTKDYTTSTRPSTSGTSGTTSDVTSASGECTEEGFFRNPDDCSKYYRCIDTGYGTYTREDYACEEDEVFDEEMRYCNRKDLAPPCDGSTPGQTSSQTKTTTDKTTSVYTTEKQTSTSTTGYPTESSTEGSKSTTAYPTESSTGGSKSECEEEGFFRCPEDCNKFYRCVEDEGYLVRYDFKCPEGLIFDEKNKKCDWPSSELTCDDSSSTKSSSSYPSTTKTTASSGSTSSSGECIEEGFFRNPDDCSKYYRCIDEGDGTLTREDFACEEDEVFDEEMRYCNKKDLAPPCEDQSSTAGSSSTSTSESATSRPSTSPTSESSTLRSTDSTTKESSTTEGYESTSGTSKKDSESGDCEEEGFHRHPDDCSKFYRCVDFKGDGQSFTRYDFDCPEGLVFDEDNDVCNWPSVVPSCESSTSSDRSTSGNPDSGVSGTSSNSQESSQTTSSGASTTVQEGSAISSTNRDVSQDSSSTTVADRRSTTPGDEDFSSTTTNDRQSTTSADASRSSTDTSTRSTSDGGSSENIECTEEGFFRHPEDCSKFYRCVDFAGTGESFVRYDFDCPEGLVFDEVNSVCNWPNQSPGCESESTRRGSDATSSDEKVSKTTTEGTDTTRDGTSTSESSFSSSGTDSSKDGTSTSEDSISSSGTYKTTESQTSGTSSGSTSAGDFQCEEEGFFKNPNDCKKYYECKRDEETGELIKIDCECPEGHVFDSEGWYCNAEELSPPCDEGSFRCTEEGFFRDPEDCTKYYQCNKTGPGNDDFRSEKFQCPDGYVFDENGRYCNAPELSEPCDETSGSTRITKSEESVSSTASTTTSSGTSSTSSSVSKGECTEEGFFRNPEDCTKYYQCSRNEETDEIERTDFTCPDGRIFDEGSSYCNDPQLSEEPCESGSTSTTRKQTNAGNADSSTNTAEQTPESTSSTEGSQADSRRSGGGPQCTQEGFFRHPDDCNKFYRCVDFSGSGESFVRYDFDCPEGLHFDEVNSVCNWPTMTPACKSESSSFL